MTGAGCPEDGVIVGITRSSYLSLWELSFCLNGGWPSPHVAVGGSGPQSPTIPNLRWLVGELVPQPSPPAADRIAAASKASDNVPHYLDRQNLRHCGRLRDTLVLPLSEKPFKQDVSTPGPRL